ncbi:Crp/Fnr family transcriptional regulator [uncultured Rhodoblastus sp.]|uniref:Crp/Fnr family transcriptional regulator n=1 Tax=uncultured Rhodoblastus sp. TaxID=543037 RepID=UPI0025ED5626|nr:Crp/Fnr family transcriptional regulator [uncultured Rhodoblastus sp.]
MDREEGMRILSTRGWLGAAPADFGQSILSRSSWERLEAGALIQTGGEAEGELIGLADGIVEMRSVVGRPDTPLMHLGHPVLWLGYGPIAFDRPRPTAASARTPVWLARISQADVKKALSARPEWWRHFIKPAIANGDIALIAAADLLIRDNERRCAAVLLRLSGRRFAGPKDSKPVDVPIMQDELAGAANLSRNSAGTMLKRMAARGLVELGHRGKIVCFPAALRAFVEQG